jgi:hypothetical protein
MLAITETRLGGIPRRDRSKGANSIAGRNRRRYCRYVPPVTDSHSVALATHRVRTCRYSEIYRCHSATSASAAASGVAGRGRCRLMGARFSARHYFYRIPGPRCRGVAANGNGQLTRAPSEIMHALKALGRPYFHRAQCGTRPRERLFPLLASHRAIVAKDLSEIERSSLNFRLASASRAARLPCNDVFMTLARRIVLNNRSPG